MGFGLTAGWAIPEHLVIAKTASVDHTLFLRLPLTLVENRYVLAKIDGNRVNKEGSVNIIKRIACMPGQVIETREQQFFCNGCLIGKGKPGYKALNKRLGKDEFFLTGDSDESFDSKYFGLVNGSDIFYCLFPVL
jgi:type IV secretory pathway protease TraF